MVALMFKSLYKLFYELDKFLVDEIDCSIKNSNTNVHPGF